MLKFDNVSIGYQVSQGLVRSVDGVSFDVARGKVTALIGESGSGKSTISNAALRMLAPNGRVEPGSRILFDGEDVLSLSPKALRDYRWRRASMVFQAAQNAMSPTLTIGQQLVDSVIDHGGDPRSPEHADRLNRLLKMVRLDAARAMPAYPHELSGGMRQRAIIAMALVLAPELVILDEPTTALDLITQSYILDILQDVHEESGLTMLFITHDLPAVARLAHFIAVMYAGKLVELSPAERFFDAPRHPYSMALLGSMPSVHGGDIKRKPLEGKPPGLLDRPSGCVFHPRCPFAVDRCKLEVPPLDDGAACIRWREIPQ